MNIKPLNAPRPFDRRTAGVSLVELMIAMAISLVILAALVRLFVSTSHTNSEMSKTNDLIENGRIAIQVLTEDLVHSGFWGGYLPHFDDLTYAGIPTDVPTAIPNPCQPYSGWDSSYLVDLIGIPVQTNDALPTGTGCLSPLTLRANSDVLVVRHADTCVPGVGNCDPDVAGQLYWQFPLCEQEKNETAQNTSTNDITLDVSSSIVDGAYVGAMLRTSGSTGAGQYRWVTGYDGSTQVATIDADWGTVPNSTTSYSVEYVLGTAAYSLHKKDCTTAADKRRYISNIYYVTDLVQNGESVPTLVRSKLDLSAGVVAQQPPVALIDGVDVFRAVLGIDDTGKTGAAVNYANAVAWADVTTKTTATNRGDGVPDRYIRCTTAAPCTPSDLVNVVAVKLFVLTRSREPTPGYTDTKTYCLGELAGDGTCASTDKVGPMNDSYKRHLFSTTVRLVNISGRRDTP